MIKLIASAESSSLSIREFSVDLRVKDSSGELRVIRCRKRVHGDYAKPELSKGWRNYVTDYELRVGDRVVLLAEEDRRLGSQYRIEARRTIILFGHEVCGGLPRAN
uniref:TF-B3 domain-containing protein n=1 Tax=Salix viminalis TaxID=40686 RepID=A0A6N2MCC8_SALVM